MIRTAVAFLAAGAALLACAPEQQVSGRALYADYCASCHGAGGKGDGPAAKGLGKKPADLTTIAARNGGTFPKVRVMSVIDGYTRRGDRSSAMPELGVALQEGPLVMVDTGEGVLTPTPVNLVALADYLERLQE
ncbi:cytochrome c [Defluviimonas sp. D31]|uniref:c-type cytochrome n=1 Tax=Defluviimonas sp. D31 TaxID=3083253 RepID=UPI00296FF702|nr:cytochrome c [Defluviimonas sp. D31]MDW4549812.1 cytochrome c [Defluviimonas sp. D31]